MTQRTSARDVGSLSYRPALDGLRAVAVVGVVTFHLIGPPAVGGWLGVDLFFVLSGFLITHLLLGDQARWGRIWLGRFWARRARRLLPSAVVVLAATMVAVGWWWPVGRRAAASLDVLSALFYVSNWRFVLGDESYFSQVLLPSPVRHFWSLSVEEQFYVFFPLLLVVLLACGVRRRVRVLVVAVVAVLSAWLMAAGYSPGVDTSRIYFGTDTRMFELLIGALGAMVAPGAFGPGGVGRFAGPVRLAAWPAALCWLVAMFTLPDTSALAYRGGLVVLCLLALVMVLAAAEGGAGGSFRRAFSARPLPHIGRVSYPWYLWHWPVWLFLTADRLHLPGPAATFAQLVVSYVLAEATHRWVEQPIRRGGVLALVPHHRRLSAALVTAAIPLLTVASLVIADTATSAAERTDTSSDGSSDVTLVPGRFTTSTPVTITLMGNSIPYSLYQGIAAHAWPGVTVTETTSFGCEPFAWVQVVKGRVQPRLASCASFSTQWREHVSQVKPNVMVYFIPQSMLTDVRHDGRVLRFGTPAHDARVLAALEQVRRQALAAGARKMAISTLACHRMPGADLNPEIAATNDDRAVGHLDDLAVRWARAHRVGVVDTRAALCGRGWSSTVNGVPLYVDGLHYTPRSSVVVWRWMMPMLRRFAVTP